MPPDPAAAVLAAARYRSSKAVSTSLSNLLSILETGYGVDWEPLTGLRLLCDQAVDDVSLAAEGHRVAPLPPVGRLHVKSNTDGRHRTPPGALVNPWAVRQATHVLVAEPVELTPARGRPPTARPADLDVRLRDGGLTMPVRVSAGGPAHDMLHELVYGRPDTVRSVRLGLARYRPSGDRALPRWVVSWVLLLPDAPAPVGAGHRALARVVRRSVEGASRRVRLSVPRPTGTVVLSAVVSPRVSSLEAPLEWMPLPPGQSPQVSDQTTAYVPDSALVLVTAGAHCPAWADARDDSDMAVTAMSPVQAPAGAGLAEADAWCARQNEQAWAGSALTSEARDLL